MKSFHKRHISVLPIQVRRVQTQIDTRSIPTAGCWMMIHTFYGIENLLLKQDCAEPNENYFLSYSKGFYLSRLLWKVFFVHSITVVILVLPRYLYNMYYTKSIDMENTVQVTYFSIYSPAPQHCRNYIHENDCVSSPAKSILTK